MQTGTYISGAGHLALILWLVFGGLIGAEPPPPPEVADVSVISAEEYAALTRPEIAPQVDTEVAAPAAPVVEETPAPAPRPVDEAPEVAQPEAAAQDDPDAAPDTPAPLPEPQAEVTDDAPEIAPPAPPAVDTPVIAPPSDTPQPAPAPRVAPIPVPEAPVTPEIADVPAPPVSPEAETPEVAEDLPEAAPEEATTEIVTEAETPSSAPVTSARPTARPVRTAAVAPEPQPAPDPAPEPAEAPADDVLAAAVADAVADAIAAPDPAPAPTPSRPAGPPLTAGEKDALRIAVQQCWNVGSLSTAALEVVVVVGVDMNPDGTPNTGTIRMLSSRGGDDAAARQAFEAARRAVIRCGARGFDLPQEKFEQWREVEMTFNPEDMRTR